MDITTDNMWMDCGNGTLHLPNGNAIATNVVERKDWGRVFEVYDYSDTPEENMRLILSAPDLLLALRGLVREVNLSKLNVRKDFSLINAHAAATKAIRKATGINP